MSKVRLVVLFLFVACEEEPDGRKPGRVQCFEYLDADECVEGAGPCNECSQGDDVWYECPGWSNDSPSAQNAAENHCDGIGRGKP